MLNHIVIMGRLTRDPEIRRTGTGRSVTSFCVAVERDYPNKETVDREVDFINCAAWQQTGEFVGKYFTKGSMIVVSGRLQIKKWTDRNEVKHYDAEIVADNVYFGESKKDSVANVNTYNASNNYYTPPVVAPTSDFAMLDDDDAQLPF